MGRGSITLYVKTRALKIALGQKGDVKGEAILVDQIASK
jgi:hypothetical protein